ncbi:MAG: NAD(P)H-dependent oxidoreductase [Patescibacteria group bacterium]
MNIVSILAAPSQNFTARMFEEFNKSLNPEKHNINLIDLYLEEFDPVLRPEKPRSSQVQKYQDQIREADLIVVFYPVWWMNIPAILKGFLDQVLVEDLAYKYDRGYPRGLLGGKRALVFSTSEQPNWQLTWLYGNSNQLIWSRGVLNYVGIRNFKFFNVDRINQVTPEKKKHIIDEIKMMATSI